jgi:hypothetical protein|tara:strand:- start:4405 stop:4755 length:351 start_codon:yes stop_codon:yes gene_type:complete
MANNKNNYNNIDKIMSSGGPNETPLDMQQFIKLASEPDEFEVIELPILLKEFDEWKKENKGTFRDFLEEKPRQKLSNGGIAEDYADLIDAYERGIDVMNGESLTQYINRIRKAEKK